MLYCSVPVVTVMNFARLGVTVADEPCILFKVPSVCYFETIQPLPDTGTKTLSASTSC